MCEKGVFPSLDATSKHWQTPKSWLTPRGNMIFQKFFVIYACAYTREHVEQTLITQIAKICASDKSVFWIRF